MTDKVQKILSEIATRKLCTMDEHMAFYNDNAKEDYKFLSEIEEVIKALQEEPVSEDDRIRKAMIDFFKHEREECVTVLHYGVNIECMIAWLEKQGEQTPVIEMKTPEESLGVDSDTYNKIVDECVYGGQKPAWSKEDEDV